MPAGCRHGAEVIRGNSILPARREPLTLQTADGIDLVGELALPADRDPVATMICLHPLPTHGGMMDSHLFRKAAYRLPALAGIAVLRFNTRGTSAASRAPAKASSTTPRTRSSTSPRPSSTRSSPTCRTSGSSAGRSAPISR